MTTEIDNVTDEFSKHELMDRIDCARKMFETLIVDHNAAPLLGEEIDRLHAQFCILSGHALRIRMENSNACNSVGSLDDLKKIVKQYDAVISLNIIPKWTAWHIASMLERVATMGHGEIKGGRLNVLDRLGRVLFTLEIEEEFGRVDKLTLTLDVPRVPQECKAFIEMRFFAAKMANVLEGLIVDNDNKPISSEALSEISKQVDGFYADMAKAGIPAGSVQAKSLFVRSIEQFNSITNPEGAQIESRTNPV